MTASDTKAEVARRTEAGESVGQISRAVGISTVAVSYHRRQIKCDRIHKDLCRLLAWALQEGATVDQLLGVIQCDVDTLIEMIVEGGGREALELAFPQRGLFVKPEQEAS